MDEVKYIPEDLVKINDVINVIDGIYPKSFSKDRIIEAHAIEGDNTNRYRYDLDFGKIVSIVPIKLTPAILEANGWKYKRESGIDTYTFGKDINNSITVEISRHKEFCLSVSDSTYINLKIEYIHQLQHLLFGLGLDRNLKV